MPRVKRLKYLLVLVDTFSGWVEAFPTSNKRATTVASIIVTHIIPQLGIPTSFQSDNGPEFTSQVTQTIIKALNIPWQFHIPYHPSSSGKVERSNHTLKEVLTNLTLELHLDWVQLPPIAFFCLWVLPRKPTQISPFEVMFRCPALPLGITSSPGPLLGHLTFPLLSFIRTHLWRHHDTLSPDPSHTHLSFLLNPGDWVYFSPPFPKKKPLTPKWKEPLKIILSTPTAAQLEETPGKLTSWIHISRLKPARPPREN
jgi:transposase InsO family protein